MGRYRRKREAKARRRPWEFSKKLAAWAVLTGGAMVAADVRTGLAALVGAGLACVYYVVTARRQFGGVTGDLAGFFLQLCELGMVLCAAVGQRLEVLL